MDGSAGSTLVPSSDTKTASSSVVDAAAESDTPPSTSSSTLSVVVPAPGDLDHVDDNVALDKTMERVDAVNARSDGIGQAPSVRPPRPVRMAHTKRADEAKHTGMHTDAPQTSSGNGPYSGKLNDGTTSLYDETHDDGSDDMAPSFEMEVVHHSFV